MREAPLLHIENLTLSFYRQKGLFKRQAVKVLHGVDLAVKAGEIAAVVGSSGSGKSLLAHAVMGLLPEEAEWSGRIHYDGAPLDRKRLQQLRGKEMAFVPQSVNYLDPLMRAGKQVRTAVAAAESKQAEEMQRKAFERSGLPAEASRLYPHQLSGGMARRVLALGAIVSGARLIIADEPTPGLDEVSLAEIANQFRELADAGCAVLFITHDIQLALRIADRVAVLYAGHVVEHAAVGDFAGDGHLLRHPYTRALWRALPENGFVPVPGLQPRPDALPSGCLYAPRCGEASDACMTERPVMRAVRGGATRCCHAT
ncbi:ABC transporter ATP-binding protein [Paenibacillus sp. NPDC058071]|uniref:ABC transporter ATP-binding protein n=1 Tax=Paenibacillus sp. NPDC058071 TaxID=3346326 RepID=UPI0036DDA8A5